MQDSLSTLSETSSNISLREYGDVLRRRRAIILQTFVVVLVAGVLVTLFTAPTYRSTARLLLEPISYNINQINSSDPLGELFRVNNSYSINTQVELLQTDRIRKEVAQKVGAAGLPSMMVSGVDGTQIIEVASEGDNPDLVASAPNALLEIYVEEAAGTNNKQLGEAIKFAKSERDLASTRLATAERDLRNFKAKNSLADLEKNREDQIKNVQEMENQYRAIENEMKVLQAKVAATNAQMQRAGRLRNETPSILADPAIQAIDTQLAAIEVDRAGLLKRFTATSVEMEPLDARRNQLMKRRVELVQQFKARTERLNPTYLQFADQLLQYNIDSATMAERASAMGKQLAAARQRLASFPSFEAEYARLSRDYENAKSSYGLFSKSLTDLLLRDKTRRPMASIMQRAEVPSAPIRPKKAQNIVLAGLLGLFFGLCLALLQELFDDRINTPEEAERVLRQPTLGHIPMIEEEGLRLIRDISSFSPLMEAYRSLRTNINFAAVGTPIHSLVVTSSVPAEGKSTTVANLAMAMALDNKRVIVVDADLRRPSLHKLFKIDSSPGLTDILVGSHTVEETIRETGVSNVSVIPAGSPPPNPAELLGSAAMGALLAQLEGKADVVLFDSPPTLLVADSVVLASRANGVVLVVGYGETKKTSTKKALEILSRANANILGTVLNRMDAVGSGYYYGKYYVPATTDRSIGAAASGRNGSGGAMTAEAPATARALPEADTAAPSNKSGDNE
jgi:capsular exopolysaccharide synthesis family protein